MNINNNNNSNNSNTIWNPNFLDDNSNGSTVVSPTKIQPNQSNMATNNSNNTNNDSTGQQHTSNFSPSQQQQQQQRQRSSHTFQFNNPWGNTTNNNEELSASHSSYLNLNSQQHLLNSNNNDNMNFDSSKEDIETFKRRKSSLVIPPTRAAAPNPFQYDNYHFFNNNNNNNNNNINIHNLNNNNNNNNNGMMNGPSSSMGLSSSPYNNNVQQQQLLFNKQKQQHQHLNSRFVPSIYNNQDFQRRQSLAASAFSNNYNSSHSIHSNNSSMNNTSNNNSNYVNNNNSNNNTNNNSNIAYNGTRSAGGSGNNNMAFNSGMSTFSTISPYRRLSAYPTSGSPSLSSAFPPHFKQLRKDELIQQQQQISIPQMQKCFKKDDLQPIINENPKFRRASVHSQTISPLKGLTKNLITTYELCSPDFIYKTCKNPKRVLTKPSEPKLNNGFDNTNSDYILFVNDVLGTEQNRKYLVLDMLGQGTFGQVVKCQNLQTKEILAVKVIKSRSEYLNQSITEAKILELLNTKIDPNNKHHFLKMHDSFVHKNHLCLVFELLSNNLYELLKQNQYHGLSIQLIKIFTKQILDSLCVLKDSKLIHCDLKPENILLCSPDKPDIKVIDFGSSCEETRTVYTYIQSRFYRAPEIILGIPYSTSIDMWSLGCIVAELFLGIPIFPGSSEFNQITRIVDTLDYPPNWMLDMGKNTRKFMSKLDNNEILTSKNNKKYKLKTIDEYNNDFKDINEKPGKQYFKWQKLKDIIKNYRIPKNIQHSNELIEQELGHRESLIHFLTGILNINPLERWTPQQASLHPFITNQPFTGEWYPPGTFQSMSRPNHLSKHSDKSSNVKVNIGMTSSNIPKVDDTLVSPPEKTTKQFHDLTITED